MYLFLVLLNRSISWFIVLQGCPRKGQGCHGCSASPGPFVSSRQPDYSIYDKCILSRFEFEVSHEANVVQANNGPWESHKESPTDAELKTQAKSLNNYDAGR